MTQCITFSIISLKRHMYIRLPSLSTLRYWKEFEITWSRVLVYGFGHSHINYSKEVFSEAKSAFQKRYLGRISCSFHCKDCIYYHSKTGSKKLNEA